MTRRGFSRAETCKAMGQSSCKVRYQSSYIRTKATHAAPHRVGFKVIMIHRQ